MPDLTPHSGSEPRKIFSDWVNKLPVAQPGASPVKAMWRDEMSKDDFPNTEKPADKVEKRWLDEITQDDVPMKKKTS